ncbi:MAG: hypothetical protein QM654_18255 [Dysgonamonadaceae bacterium]
MCQSNNWLEFREATQGCIPDLFFQIHEIISLSTLLLSTSRISPTKAIQKHPARDIVSTKNPSNTSVFQTQANLYRVIIVLPSAI